MYRLKTVRHIEMRNKKKETYVFYVSMWLNN